MRLAFLPAIFLGFLGSLYSQTYRATPPPRPYSPPPLPPPVYVPGYGPNQNNRPTFMYNPNGGPAAQPGVAQPTYVPPQNYVPRQAYTPSQTYVPQTTYRPPPQPTPGANVVKQYIARATPVPTIAPLNRQPLPYYHDYSHALPPTRPLLAPWPAPPPGVQPLSDAEKWIIDHESQNKTTAGNPDHFFGLGQLRLDNRTNFARLLNINPNSTNYWDQVALMRAYIRSRYGTAENAEAAWITHYREDLESGETTRPPGWY